MIIGTECSKIVNHFLLTFKTFGILVCFVFPDKRPFWDILFEKDTNSKFTFIDTIWELNTWLSWLRSRMNTELRVQTRWSWLFLCLFLTYCLIFSRFWLRLWFTMSSLLYLFCHFSFKEKDYNFARYQ